MARPILLSTLLLAALSCAPPDPDPPTPSTEPWLYKPSAFPRLHPHLSAQELPLLRARIAREPYASLWARIESRSTATPALPNPQELYAPTAYTNADIARAAAFRAWMDPQALCPTLPCKQKAMDLLAGQPSDAGLLTTLDHDIHLADAMVGYATAYDLLEGMGLTEEERAPLTARLDELAESSYQVFGLDYPYLQTFNPSNHGTKLAAGIGIIALVRSDSPRAPVWLAYAMNTLYALQASMTSPDGVVAEGPFYHLYSAQTHLPFYLAYQDLLELALDSGWTAQPSQTYPLPPSLTEGFGLDLPRPPSPLPPPMSWEITRAQHRWGRAIRMPDGDRVPLDDSFLGPYYGGLLDDAQARWDWLEASAHPLHTRWTVDLAMETLLRFDDDAPVLPPVGPPSFAIDGSALLRSGWGEQDLMVHCNGESGALRDTGHEQEDEGSFSLFAQGHYLLLDPGYIRYEDRERVAHTRNHNLVLVDGEGAPQSTELARGGVDGSVSFRSLGPDADACTLATAYAGMELHRRVLRLGKELVVVADALSSSTGAHRYSWLLHGWGGGSDGGSAELSPGLVTQASWDRDGAALDAAIVSDGQNPSASLSPFEHGFSWNNAQTHQRLSLEADSPDGRWHVLALLQPRASTSLPALVQPLDLGPGVLALLLYPPQDLGKPRVVVYDPLGESHLVALPGCPSFTTSSDLTLARLDCVTGELEVLDG